MTAVRVDPEFQDLIPRLSVAEREQLEANLIEAGRALDSLKVWDGVVLDGHNRLDLCRKHDLPYSAEEVVGIDSREDAFLWIEENQLGRRNLTDDQRAAIAYRVMQRRVEITKRARASKGGKAKAGCLETDASPKQGERTRAIVAKEAKVSQRKVRTIQQLAKKNPNVVDQIAKGETTVNEEKKRQYAADVAKQAADINAGKVSLPEGVFEVIVIDPPWPYGTAEQYSPSGFRGSPPYPEMSIEDLSKLQLPAATDCVLWVWTTSRFMEEACQLCRAWGFEKKNILTWDKQDLGLGRWLRHSTEFCIFAVRGRPKLLRHDIPTLLSASRREHSRKPDEFYELVESACIGRRLDFFSREKREGWDQVGNEASKFQGAA